MPTINSINSNIPIEISKGGTNATTMATTDGVVYYDGTRLVTTGVGAATQVLTSNGPGLAPTFQASGAGAGSFVLIQTQPAAAVTALNFTTGIMATYNNYLIIGSNVTSASVTINSVCVLQLSTDGGGTYDSTNYTIFATGPAAGLYLTTSPSGEDWTSAVAAFSTSLTNLTSGSGTILSISSFYSSGLANTGGIIASDGGTKFTVANQTINAVRIVMNDGATFSGTFSLYGYVV